MEYINYKKISTILKDEKDTLVFDFSGIDTLNTFEVAELFVHSVLIPFDGSHCHITGGNNDIVKRLYQAHFFQQLEKIKNITASPETSLYTDIENIIELQAHTKKTSFYTNEEKIENALKRMKVKESDISLITSSLGEVIDNAFSHNLGKWSPATGPMVVFFMQEYPQEKKLCFAICDLGVGFFKTLHNNYPHIKTEEEAIAHALRPDVTGRENKKGGNGLTYLKKNVFNGFKGDLYIRSLNTFFSVKTEENIKTSFLQKGSGVFFSLFYS